MITPTQLKQIIPSLTSQRASTWTQALQKALDRFQINSSLREAAFIAQIAHESGELRFLTELWGPTPTQKLYEPPSTKASELGNSQRGDGFKFRGRGPIQITGRSNVTALAEDLSLPNLIDDPSPISQPALGSLAAGWFWQTHGLNPLADRRDFQEITRRINGGLSGLQNRLTYYNRAIALLLHPSSPPPSSPPSSASLKILVDGNQVEANASFDGNSIRVQLRPIAQAAAYPIISINKGIATLLSHRKETYQVPCILEGGRSYSLLHDIPGNIVWDPQNKAAILKSI